MKPNTIIITRTLHQNQVDEIRRCLRDIWPGRDWTIHHGQMLRNVEDLQAAVGPSEIKCATEVEEYGYTTATPVPRWEA